MAPQLAPLAFALPLAVAALLVAGTRRLPRAFVDAIAVLTSAAVVIIASLLVARSSHGPIVYWLGNWPPRNGVAVGIGLAIDGIGAGLALLAAILVTASLIFSIRYFEAMGALYHALLLVFLAAMVGFALTGDLFNLFVFFELMSVAAYALTAYKIEDEQALEGALNFAITNSIGAFGALAGIALLYGRTGALNMAQLGRSLAGYPVDGLVLVAFTLITVGFLVKSAAVPLHFWLADAHAVAPTPVCVLFSGVMVELGVYAVARIYWIIFSTAIPSHSTPLRNLLIALGILTALVGGTMCFAQRHLKRLLAFSTVSHTGIFLIGVAVLSAKGLAGAALYVLGHGFVKAALFLGAGMLLHARKSVDEMKLHGRGKGLPVVGIVFFLGGLGLASAPPFGMFVGKSLIEEAADTIGHPEVTAVLIIASVLTGGAVLRATGRIFFDWGDGEGEEQSGPQANEKTETESSGHRLPLSMTIPAVALLMLGLCTGIVPHLTNQAMSSAELFVDQKRYAAAVLDKKPVVTAPPREDVKTELSGFLSGTGSAALALALGWLSLAGRRRFKAVMQLVGTVTRAPLQWLRMLHSGLVGDYVLWVAITIVVFVAFLAATIRNS